VLSLTEIEMAALWDNRRRRRKNLTASPNSQKKKKKEQGSRGDLHGTLSPDQQRSRFADVTGRGSLFALHLPVEEYKCIIQSGTGRSPLPLLSFIYRLALGYFSCMVDILLNTSFLDDMGDHSKSKLFLSPPFVSLQGFVAKF